MGSDGYDAPAHCVVAMPTGQQTILDAMPDGLVIVNPQGVIIGSNAAALSIFGYEQKQLVGLTIEALLPERFRAGHVAKRNDYLTAPRHRPMGQSLKLLGQRRDGSEFPVEVSLSPYRAGRQVCAICIIRDVSDRERRQAELQRAELRYRTVVEQMPAVTFMASLDGRANEFYVSPQIEKLLGFSQQEWLNDPVLWYTRLHPDDRERWHREFAQTCSAGTEFCAEYRFLAKSGKVVWVQGEAKMIRDAQGAPLMLHGIAFDITARKEAENVLERSRDELEEMVRTRTAELARAALIDKLTGLPNRSLLMDRLQKTLDRSRRSARTFAVMFLDFDRFKIVNDSLGHGVGDALLQEIGRRLTREVRCVDTVSCTVDGDSTARMGGDEFVILLDEIRHADAAAVVADRMLIALAEPYRLGQHEVFSTASIGIVVGPAGYERAEDVIRDADTAMYEAKRAGKGRYVLFDDSMRSRVQRRHMLENDLRRAVDANQLSFVFQPIVSLETGETHSVEALLRWRHATAGDIGPAEFIPIAEESNLILALGEWVLREGARQMADWIDRLGPAAPPTISLNLSRKQFIRSDLPEQIRGILKQTGLPAERLQLEVTEDAFASDVKAAIAAMNAIKRLGVQLAIDDFGAGCSTFASLHEFPADVLKVDRSLLSDIEQSKDTAALIHSLAVLVRNLGLTMVAEGIERASQAVVAQELGCQLAQGYFFARPMPADKLEEFLVERQSAASVSGAMAFESRWSPRMEIESFAPLAES